MEQIRNVRPGDEDSLAYVQTESWKAAFREIVPADILAECTALESTAAIYRRILDEGFGNGYLMELDGKPRCIAWWSVARDANMAGYAELICLHSLQENWHKGYGRAMMERVLADVKKQDMKSSCSGCSRTIHGRFNSINRSALSRVEGGVPPWARSRKCTANRCDAHQ